jgi:hypothetical protein
MTTQTARLKIGLSTLALIGAAQAAPISMAPVSVHSKDLSWQRIQGTTYDWADANTNGLIDIGETVTFSVTMAKQFWGKHSFDALKVWIDGTPVNPPSSTLFTDEFAWNFSTWRSRGNDSYSYRNWTGGTRTFSFDYTFTTAGVFALTASVMCSADLSILTPSGSFDNPTSADWNAWTHNTAGTHMAAWQGETERYNLQVHAPEAVPEPGTMALFLLGLSGMAYTLHSRRKKSA